VPFAGTKGLPSGLVVADLLDKYYTNSIECNSNSTICSGGKNSCLKSYDQYSYKNCYQCGTNNLGKNNYSDLLDTSLKILGHWFWHN
jgi:hypothetical protein